MDGVRKLSGAILLFGVLALSLRADTLPLPKVEGLEPEKWLIDNADVVLAINIQQIMTAELMKKGGKELLKEVLKEDERLKEMLEATGLDVTKDVSGVVASAQAAGKQTKALIVVKGNFDLDKVAKSLQKKNGKGTLVGEYTVYPVKIQDQPMHAVLPDKNTLIIAHTKEEAAGRAKNGGRVAKVSPNMSAALKSNFKGGDNLVMAMLVTPEMKKQLEKVPPQVSGELLKMKTVTAGLSITDGVGLNINGYTGDAKSARQVAAKLELLKAAAAFVISSQENLPPGTMDMLNELKIEASKDSAIIRLKMSKEQLEKISKGDK